MAAFQTEHQALSRAGVEIIAISADDHEGAEKTVRDCDLTFPVGFGLPLHDTARQLGVYFEERRAILHAAGFLLGPDRRIQVAVSSSGAVGRLQPDEILRLVAFWDREPR